MDVGVIIGRFQVDDLSEGHLFLIDSAIKNHRRVFVFLGMDPMMGTRSNPLDYPSRERMIKSRFPDVTCLPLPDHRSDETWSKQIDDQIKMMVPNVSSVTLYGGRDSFVPFYKGKWKAIEIDSGISYINASQKRSDIGKVILDSPDWRKGIIHSTENSESKVILASLVACVHPIQNTILLKKHVNDEKWSLPGNVPSNDVSSLEDCAKNTLNMWTNMNVDFMRYAGSGKIKLWHFKSAKEFTVIAALFIAQYSYGSMKDVHEHEQKWVPISDVQNYLIDDQMKILKSQLSILKK